MNKFHLKTLGLMAIAPVIVLAIHNVFGIDFGLYTKFHWFDIPMHLIGGIAIAISANIFIDAVQKEHRAENMNWQLRAIFIISLVVLAAVLWEFGEFTVDTLIYHHPHFQPSNADTMKDLFMGLLGGTMTAIYYLI